MKSPCARRARLVRSLGLDRNSLRRPSDKLEAYLLLVMITVFVPLAVVISCFVANLVDKAGLHQQHADQPRQVTAMVLANAPIHYSALLGSSWEWVPARWSANDVTHVGAVLASAGTRRGATVRIWIDRSGHVSRPPLTAGQLKWRAVTSMTLATAALGLVILLTLSALHGILNRRRLAAWDSAWTALCERQARPR